VQAHTKKFDLLKIRAKSLKIRQRQLQMRLNDEIRLKMNTGARRDKLKIVFFGGHANNFEILFGIGEIRAYFALWISLHFFFERKICNGFGAQKFFE